MEAREPTPYELAILHGLQFKPIYQGTVFPHEVEKRRAANKVGRKQRRINRVRSK